MSRGTRQSPSPPLDYTIDRMKPEDWEQVRKIYIEGIATGHATFEKDAPTWDAWNSRHLTFCRLVARSGGKILAWAALSMISSHSAYTGVAEVNVYTASEYRGKGIGSDLIARLIEESEKEDIWTLQASVFPENRESLSILRKHGFRVVGKREKIGKMLFGEHAGRWRDVVLYERRSEKIE